MDSWDRFPTHPLGGRGKFSDWWWEATGGGLVGACWSTPPKSTKQGPIALQFGELVLALEQ